MVVDLSKSDKRLYRTVGKRKGGIVEAAGGELRDEMEWETPPKI